MKESGTMSISIDVAMVSKYKGKKKKMKTKAYGKPKAKMSRPTLLTKESQEHNPYTSKGC